MKYISFDVKMGSLTRRQVVVFPNDLTHSIMADGVLAALRNQFPTASLSIHAAGFAESLVASTYEHSESMGIPADPEDAARFNLSDYGGHIL